ncbi:hypothetical protein BJ165DRAFT_1515868 [Panaeolus papilionaceus]|nr:hypothetical protein BJ165DRAFT_1515868 [Panaeolus papilionaceus]
MNPLPAPAAPQNDGLDWLIDESSEPYFHWVVHSNTEERTVFATKAVVASNEFEPLRSTLTPDNLMNVKLALYLRKPSGDIENGDLDRTRSKLEDLVERYPRTNRDKTEINDRSLIISSSKTNFFKLKIQHPFTGSRYNILGNEPYQRWKASLDNSFQSRRWKVLSPHPAPPTVVEYQHYVEAWNTCSSVQPAGLFSFLHSSAVCVCRCSNRNSRPPPFGPENPYPTSDDTIVADYTGPPITANAPRPTSSRPTAPAVPPIPVTPMRHVAIARLSTLDNPTPVAVNAQRAAYNYPTPVSTAKGRAAPAREVPGSPTRHRDSETPQDDELQPKSMAPISGLASHIKSSLKRRYPTPDPEEDEWVRDFGPAKSQPPSKKQRTIPPPYPTRDW